jgi:hypothetical protein
MGIFRYSALGKIMLLSELLFGAVANKFLNIKVDLLVHKKENRLKINVLKFQTIPLNTIH